MLRTLIHFYHILYIPPNHNTNFKATAQLYPHLTLTVSWLRNMTEI